MLDLRIGSLFSGIGGLELGLERAGVGKTVWHCESDPFARRVLAAHWPGVPCSDDVRTFSPGPGSADLICGGFPCQDISEAGRRAGIEGSRSGLWSEFARIIGQVRPRFVLVENVSALLRRGLDRVLGDLAALGYDAEWHCIPAGAAGALHRRDRIFILAYAAGEPQPESGHGAEAIGNCGDAWLESGGRSPRQSPPQPPSHLADPNLNARLERGPSDGGEGAGGRDAHRSRVGADPMGHPHREGLAVGPCLGSDARPQLQAACRASRTGAGFWAVEPDVGRVAPGVPGRVDRLRALGNAVVPQVAEFIGRRLVEMMATTATAPAATASLEPPMGGRA